MERIPYAYLYQLGWKVFWNNKEENCVNFVDPSSYWKQGTNRTRLLYKKGRKTVVC